MTYQEIQKTFETLDRLKTHLYEYPGCSVGGPLHVILDDGNMGDSAILFCWCEAHKGSDRYLKMLCKAILELFFELTYPQRVVWYLKERVARKGVDPVQLALNVVNGEVIDEDPDIFDPIIKVDGNIIWNGLYQ